LLNSQILAEIVLSDKEKRVRKMEKSLIQDEELELDQEFKPEEIIKNKFDTKKYPKEFFLKANKYSKMIYEVNCKNKSLYSKAAKLGSEL
jgi:hypothetical protein